MYVLAFLAHFTDEAHQPGLTATAVCAFTLSSLCRATCTMPN